MKGPRKGRRVIAAFTLFLGVAGADTLRVGPGRQYHTPCQAISAASSGDRIEIDGAGTYRGDVCAWKTDGLTIVGVNGRPKIDAAGRNAGGKAIWVISGSNTTVENVEFTGAAVPSHNGAAIRQEGSNLILRNCYIHGNQEGILTGEDPSSNILIENTEFGDNGYRDGYSHNIYIGHVAQFTLRFSYSHDAISGHLVKSRALKNFILYNRLTGESGTSSYDLDLPNGGPSFVIGNVIEQGRLSENNAVIAYAEEGASNTNSTLYFINNTVINNRGGGVFIKTGTGTAPAVVQNNIFTGRGTIINQANARLSHNLNANGLFVDAGAYDYHLRPESPARDFGTNPGAADGYPLTPAYQYVHASCFEVRNTAGTAIDAGALEFLGGGGADRSCLDTRGKK